MENIALRIWQTLYTFVLPQSPGMRTVLIYILELYAFRVICGITGGK